MARPAASSIPMWTPDPVWTSREYFLLRLVGNATRSPSSGLPRLLSEFLNKPLAIGSMQYTCIKALTSSYHSMRAAGPRACHQAMVAYSHAMRAVSVATQKPYRGIEPDVLMSIMCLCLYENIVVTAPRSWIQHYIGVSRLIAMHGPAHYKSGINRDILLAFRYNIIISAGTLRQPCFLAQPAWREAIELNEAESRDIFETILNIAVDVPGLLHAQDCLARRRLPSDSDIFKILKRTMNALRDWWYTSWTACSGDERSSMDTPYGASAIAFHHMLLLLVEDLCHRLNVPWLHISPVSPAGVPTMPHEPPTTSSEDERSQHRHAVATTILHLAQRSIDAETRIYGILRFIMPLHVAHDYLLPGSAEMHALGHLMNAVMAGQHGFQMARRHDMQYTSFPESL
ncbi:hypothetical protein BJY01DRAFT_251763 [Aspergillus pseudoustus]|uniref:Zn(II)2Cys6 transcription factor n=1 Tax=Aspergillus pseudoustus TaxID=1810923 RepID=A0ABR4JA81_9EURO